MMTSTYGPLIKLALLILCLAMGVIVSVTIIAKESQQSVPKTEHAKPFAKSLNNVHAVTRLERQIQRDINRLTPGHREYDQRYVNSLLTSGDESSDSKVEL